MRTPLRSVLLLGVIVIVLCAATGAQSVAARPTQGNTTSAPSEYPLQVAITGGGTLANAITSSSFWMTGGSVDLAGRFYGNWSVVADVAGMHKAQSNSNSVGLDMVTATFGPRYSWQPKGSKYALFGQALAGEAFSFHTVIPTPHGAADGDTSLALLMGGGLDVNLNRRLALRAVEANWLHTQLPNSTTNTQNSLRLSAGVAFRFR